MQPRSLLCRVTIAAVFIGLAASAGPAQRVSGVVFERDGTTPASFVALLVIDSLGATVARGQSSATGGFALDVPKAGRYTVRALRVGFRPTVTPVFAVAADTPATLRVQLAGEHIVLETVRVRERSICSLTSAGSGLIDAWDQARAALLGTTESEPTRDLKFESIAWIVERDVWPDSGLRGSVDPPRQARGDAFRSKTARELLRGGFVQGARDSIEFHAPDAFVLLDPEFASSYCFWRQPGPQDHADWIGLGVASAQNEPTKVTIEGVLWLKPNGALVRFDYRYVGLDKVLEPAEGGGRVEFLQLPSGQWIVSRWSIRMPQMVNEMQSVGLSGRQAAFKRLGRIVERGAFVSRVESADRQFLELGNDSLRLTLRSSSPQPIAGTTVRLPSEDQEWVADISGVVALGMMRPGNYRVLVQTPLMRDVGLRPDAMDLTLLPGSTGIRAEVSIPSTTEVRRRLCPGIDKDAAAVGATSRASEFGALYVSPASDLADSTKRPTRWKVVELDSLGRWHVCGVQRGVTLALWGERAGVRETLARFRISRTVDLALVGALNASPFSVAGTLPPPEREGATLIVRVLAAKDSTPIRDAQPVLDDSLLARPNANGQYRFPGQDEGAHHLLVRRLGYLPVGRSVMLSDTGSQTETVYMERLPQLLSEVVVRGRAMVVPSKYVDVLRRTASGWGTLFTRDDLKQAYDVKSLLSTLPGVEVFDRNVRFHRCEVSIDQAAPKKVQVYIDGVRVTMLNPAPPPEKRPSIYDEDPVIAALKLVSPSDIEFMEVYRGPAQIPGEFVNDACAVIAIWTRAY